MAPGVRAPWRPAVSAALASYCLATARRKHERVPCSPVPLTVCLPVAFTCSQSHAAILTALTLSSPRKSPGPRAPRPERPSLISRLRRHRCLSCPVSTLQAPTARRDCKQSICFCFSDSAKASDCVGHNKLWEILREMGIPDHPTCLCMQVKRQQLELDTEQQTGSKLGKECVKAVYCHPAYLTYMQSTSCKMPDWRSTNWNQDCWEKYQ